MKPFPVLRTSRCLQTPVTQMDIPILRQILDDADTRCFLPELCDAFQTTESLMQFITSFDKYFVQGEGFLWSIRKDDVLIGFIAIMDVSYNPILFYAMHPDFRNCGYMNECLTEVMQYIYRNNICKSINTEVYKENLFSQQLLARMGFMLYKKDSLKVYYRKTL